MTGKICTGCGEDKSLADYSPRAEGKLQARCRVCQAAYAKKWRVASPDRPARIAAAKRAKYATDPERHRAASRAYLAANPDRVRDHNLRRKYGISLAEYDAMLAAQNDRCAGCGGTGSGDRRFDTFAVDHDHETGKVRGLLCSRCNTALGLLGDDPDRLMALVAYLLQHANVLGEVRA